MQVSRAEADKNDCVQGADYMVEVSGLECDSVEVKRESNENLHKHLKANIGKKMPGK
ncbi:hypothetical protein T12_4907 [Trichinella patagoniensis]|uniref:Uncharacterized protein n=1 Tax=Trichinella patagoniensis TaxID=990121 RepID=A0A0V1A0K7_9BILA|nr:hypothetical protein T12_4907 [Trichinella patagoniensis]